MQGQRGHPRGPPAPRRVLIVDDHPLVRRGLRTLIAGESDLVVCAEAATRQAGLEASASSRPDLVIVDSFLGDDSGLALVRNIRSSQADLPILVLGAHDISAHAELARRAGASSYVAKQEPTETLLRAMRRLLDGEAP